MENLEPTAETKMPVKRLQLTRKQKFIFGGAGAVFLVLIVVGILVFRNQTLNQPGNFTNEEDKTISFQREPFAKIDIEEVTLDPQVPAYVLGDNFVNVINFKRFDFNDKIKADLAANKFAVVQRDEDETSRAREEFFQTYENNRYNQIPNFITTDAVMHNYHLVFDDTLKTLETTIFFDQVSTSANQMFELSKQQYDYFSAQSNESLTQAATRNVAYFAVALKLLGKEVEVPAYAAGVVNSELAMINEAKGIAISPVVNMFTTESLTDQFQEDYSQYIPRGHYTSSEQLKKYFKSMMWLGRITFRQKNDSENFSALLVVQAISSDQAAYKNWSNVYDAIGFIIGNADDLGIYEYLQVAKTSFGELTNENIANPTLQTKFLEDIKKLAPPKINSVPIYDADINADREKQIKGFRFMGQRYTIDANIFQNLIYRSVGANSQDQKRYLPKSLDVLAAMGSEKAQSILDSEGVNDYAKYTENMQSLKQTIANFEQSVWTANLYSGWLYSIKPLLNPLTGNVPEFMKNDAWVKKDMNTYQGSWTELKHDTLLYTKQSYAEMGAGGNTPLELDFRGYVEPRVDLYVRLEALAKALNTGLTDRGLLSGEKMTFTEPDPACPAYMSQQQCTLTTVYAPQEVKANIEAMTSMAQTLKNISIKELQNVALSDDENNFIKEIGGKFEHTWVQSLHKQIRPSEIYENLTKNPSMLVADVATDPNGQVLEEGTGRLMDIFVIIPVPGKDGTYLRVAHGLVFSHYEFTQPISERLNDQQWQSKVRKDDVPAFESWKDFIIQKTNITAKRVPVSYAGALSQGWMTISDAQRDCEVNLKGTYMQCGNACPEENPSCGKACEPICKTY